MTRTQIARLVRRIAHTMEIELDCAECGKHFPSFVDSILAGEDEAGRWVLIREHLEQCSVCAQEFAVLKDAAKMDLEDSWPSQSILLRLTARHDFDD